MRKKRSSSRSPRHRPKKRDDLDSDRTERDAEQQQVRRTRAEADQFHKDVVDQRLRVLIEQKLGGRAEVERVYGISHATVSGWLSSKSRSFPNLLTLWRLTRVSGTSIDWLCGYDVPMSRSDREVVGDLRRRLVGLLAQRTGYPPDFVDPRVPSSDRLLHDLVEKLEWDLVLAADYDVDKLITVLGREGAAEEAMREAIRRLGIPLG